MISIVVATHCDLAQSIVRTVENIIGYQKAFIGVGVDNLDTIDDIKHKIMRAVQKVEEGNGVILFTDMLGGSPSIAAFDIVKNTNAKIITGVNLPMILEALLHRNEVGIEKLPAFIISKGKKSIKLLKI